MPDESRRVNRGGSWNNQPDNVRSANRNRNDPTNRNNNLGFRLAQADRAECLFGSGVRVIKVARSARAVVHEHAVQADAGLSDQ